MAADVPAVLAHSEFRTYEYSSFNAGDCIPEGYSLYPLSCLFQSQTPGPLYQLDCCIGGAGEPHGADLI